MRKENFEIGEDRTIGPKPVSSSRTTTMATKAVVISMNLRENARLPRPSAQGAFLWMAPPPPRLTLALATRPKLIRAKRNTPTQNTGERIWYLNSKAAILPNMVGSSGGARGGEGREEDVFQADVYLLEPVARIVVRQDVDHGGVCVLSGRVVL